MLEDKEDGEEEGERDRVLKELNGLYFLESLQNLYLDKSTSDKCSDRQDGIQNEDSKEQGVNDCIDANSVNTTQSSLSSLYHSSSSSSTSFTFICHLHYPQAVCSYINYINCCTRYEGVSYYTTNHNARCYIIYISGSQKPIQFTSMRQSIIFWLRTPMLSEPIHKFCSVC